MWDRWNLVRGGRYELKVITKARRDEEEKLARGVIREMAFIRSESRDTQRVRDEPRRPTKRLAKDHKIYGRIPRTRLALGKIVQEC